LGHELLQVFRERVIVEAACRLAGLTEASAVVGDDTIASTEKDRLSIALVLITIGYLGPNCFNQSYRGLFL